MAPRTGPATGAQRVRVAGYVRLSSMTEATTSPQRQREQITAYCDARGWELAEMVEDLGESGSRVGLGLDRPGLANLRERWGEFDVVMVAKLDRLARNVRDFAQFAEEAAAADCALVVVTEGLDLSSPTGRFVATILAAFAEMEADQIKGRVVAMRDDSRKPGAHRGRYFGGSVPYGYQRAPRAEGGMTLVVDEDEARVVREATARLLGGESLMRVANDLTARGVQTKRGNKWTFRTLSKMLSGYAPIGVRTHEGEPLREEDGTLRVDFPPLISRAEWERLQVHIDSRRREAPRARMPKRLLSGVLRCAECGHAFYTRRRANAPDQYQCEGRARGAGHCTASKVAALALETEVERQWLDRAGSTVILRRSRRTLDQTAELAQVEDLIRHVTQQMATEDGELEPLLARLSELKGRRAQLRAAPASREVLEWLGYGDQLWSSADTEGRVQLLRDTLDAALVGPRFDSDKRVVPTQQRVTVQWAEHLTWTDQGEAGGQGWLVLGGMPPGAYAVEMPDWMSDPEQRAARWSETPAGRL